MPPNYSNSKIMPHAPADTLLNPDPTYVYTDDFFKQPEANIFLQNIQPNEYSFSMEKTPINSNLGITYMPQIPPIFSDQVYTQNGKYPIYTRIDPQLIRESGPASNLTDQPRREAWSAKYSDWEVPGSTDYNDIYSPDFSGYSTGLFNSYSDVNSGNTSYYVSDYDSYRYPNFIVRSNVDFIDYTDPQGKTSPQYERISNLNQYRPIAESEFVADTSFFRDSIMESNMRKMNSENWQARQAPLSRQANSRYSTYGY